MLMHTLPLALSHELHYLDQVEALVHRHDNSNLHFGRLGNIRLNSSFQTIYSLAHQRSVGYEALLRPSLADGLMLSPLAFFDTAENEAEAVFMDRLCRILHIRNFMAQARDMQWLFLNLNPQVTLHGRQHGNFFAEVLRRHRIPPHRVVIEILEGQIEDEGLLAEAVSYYKDMGCLIAIDDFGAGHSNFDRIWRIAPHIVKLDRSTILQASQNPKVRRVIPSLVGLIHEAGSLALMEGIETEEQALIAMDAGVDLVQGYYFGRPEPRLPDTAMHPGILPLFEKTRQSRLHEDARQQSHLEKYLSAFQGFARQMLSGMDPQAAAQAFLNLPKVERCYLLDQDGMQVGSNLASPRMASQYDPRCDPLNDARQAIWARRHYFHKAISHPGILKVSKPYLSITGGTLCITLSMAIRHAQETIVLCGDLRWSD